jgi:penicillin amidase
MDSFRNAVSMIAAPGLNVVYADAEDNIAWYSAAKYVRRKPGANPNILLNGSGGEEWLGYYDFDFNPKIENPSRGVVLSANTNPSPDSAGWFPGYYVPYDRFLRINQFFHSKRIFSLDDMKNMTNDITNVNASLISQSMISKLRGIAKVKTQIHERSVEILDRWNGSHNLNDQAPVIYYKLLYHVLYNIFVDEIGVKDFEAFLKTHAQKSVLKSFMENDTSAWWDNINSKHFKEGPRNIVETAFDTTINQLMRQFGPNPDKWLWKKVHTIEIEHILGNQKPLDRIFNIGPFPTRGGIETVNNQSFELNEHGIYKVNLAPALRRTLDFADPENGYNISPSGQSGNFMSRYYHDQTKMYVNGLSRKEMMNRKEIEKNYSSKMTFLPQR